MSASRPKAVDATSVAAQSYNPVAHYDAVKNKWIGTTPPPD